MNTIISILLEQVPTKIGPNERDCVKKSARIALTIVRDDLETMVHADAASRGNNGQPLEGCLSLGTLCHILHKKKAYYKSNKTYWNNGLPEVLIQMISTFKKLRGFYLLGLFMEKRGQQQQQPPPFPFLDNIQIILEALKDSITLPSEGSNEESNEESNHTQDTLRICNATKSHLLSLDEESLKHINRDTIKGTMHQLERLYD
jgi:hypothetical protein